MKWSLGLGLVTIVALAAVPSAAGDVDRITNRYDSPEASVAPGESATDRQSCRRGEKLVGGGAWTGSGRVVLSESAPGRRGNAWVASAVNTGDITGGLRAEAFCASDARRDRVKRIVTSTRTVSSAPSDDPYHGFAHEASELADCGENRLIVGGGSLTSGTDSYLNQGYPEGNSAATVRYWRGDAVGDSGFTLTVFAFCARPSGRDRVEHIRLRRGRPAEIPSGGSQDAYAQCRRGERLVSGGARGTGGDSDAIWLQSSAPHPGHPRRWLARAVVQVGSPPGRVTAYAFCALR